MTSERECIQRTYTAEQVAQILGISLRKAYGLCETTTQFKVMRLGKRCRGRLISIICKKPASPRDSKGSCRILV